jgi:hypothetical protein
MAAVVDRQAEIETLLEQALRLAPERREAFLAAACPSEELRRELAALLPYAEGAADFLHSPLLRPPTPDWVELLAAGASEEAARRVSGIPIAIGGYRIVRLIGYGGMGLIYEARRAGSADAVALKLPYPGLATPQVLRRFASETRVLARLRAPGIARVLEAGVEQIPDPSGKLYPLPFLVMELVRGERLDVHARRPEVSLADRLRLFAEVCDAVHHAHQQGVIHRDLKPANILVEESGRPKVLDFGIARLIENAGEHPRLTTTGNVIGSLAYMSPEQLGGGSRRVDAAADIYALGVICYEMLTGRLPFDVRGLSVAEAAVAISRTAAPPLGAHDRALAGELATIVARAIDKDPRQRHHSAAELSADVRRCLESLPAAAPPRRRARLRVLAGRIAGWLGRARRVAAGACRRWLRPPVHQKLRGFEDGSQLIDASQEMGETGMAQAAEAAGDLPPIIIDVGKVKRRDLRDFKAGHGQLVLELKAALEETRKTLGADTGKKEIVPVVLVYRKKRRRRRSGGGFPFFF